MGRRRPGSSLLRERIGLVALAIRKLCLAASDAPGRDCWLLHALGREVLRERYGIPSMLCAGFAAWRVDGSAGGGVVLHGPSDFRMTPEIRAMAESGLASGGGMLPYHAWLELRGRILDLTTWQLPEKVAALDAMDGQRTPVSWAPDFLWCRKKDSREIRDVIQGYRDGLFSYRRVPEIERFLERSACSPDPEDLVVLGRVLDLVERGEAVEVVGPNLF